MSRALGCYVETQMKRTAADWWVLLSECMQQHGFLYDAPHRPKEEGRFFSTFFPDPNSGQGDETNDDWGPFTSLLQKATELEQRTHEHEASSLIAPFWAQDDEGFYVEPQLTLERTGWLSLHVGIEAANFLLAISVEQLQRRVRRSLACCQTIWEVSQPSQGEMYWNWGGDPHASCAAFGVSPHLPDVQRAAYDEKPLHYVEQIGKHGALFFIADPFPVAQSGSEYWMFLPLGMSRE